MSFYPNKDQEYYLVPKHSQDKGMVLGVEDNAMGRQLQLKEIDPDDSGQKFRFDPSGATYWIKLPKYDLYLNIAQAGTGNGTPVVSFHFEDVNHEKFLLLPANDGYYRIKSYSSNKFFDVYQAKTAKGSGVVQFEFSGTDNQLFKLVAVAEQQIGKDPASFVESNEMVRTAALEVVGKIPDVGAGLAFVIGAFWTPENKLAALWDQMKAYVDARLEVYFKKAKLDALKATLEGTMEKLAKIKASDLNRGDRLLIAADTMVKDRVAFKDSIEEALPYFVTFQTILIALRHTLYNDFDTLFKDAKGDLKKLKEEALASLIEEIDTQKLYVDKKRAKILTSRLDKIGGTVTLKGNVPEQAEDNLAKVKDQDGVLLSGGLYLALDNYDGWRDYQSSSENLSFAVAERKKQIEVQFNVQLDELLYTFRFWEHFKPGAAQYVPTVKKVSTGSYGRKGGLKSFDRVYGKRITGIKLYTQAYNAMVAQGVEGIEVFYDDDTQGVQGRSEVNTYGEITTIELKTDEWICSVYGRSDFSGLLFLTNTGRWLSGSGFTLSPQTNLGYSFCADLPDSVNAKLVGISGTSDDSRIKQLTFHWEYVF
jgi:hypothetical protein